MRADWWGFLRRTQGAIGLIRPIRGVAFPFLIEVFNNDVVFLGLGFSACEHHQQQSNNGKKQNNDCRGNRELNPVGKCLHVSPYLLRGSAFFGAELTGARIAGRVGR